MLQKEFERQGNFLFRYRGILPLVILFSGFAVYTLKDFYTISEPFFLSENFRYICFSVALFGQLIRVLTVGFTPENTSGRNTHCQLADEVNTTGIYSLVRHPLYLGNFFMWLGLALVTGDVWFVVAFIFLYWIYYERIMYAEEMYLHRKFGSCYDEWAERTPAFVPSFRNFQKPKICFSFMKILKKEKNGINAIFLIFFIFDFISNIIAAKKFVIVTNFWFYAMIISFSVYFILKFLKRMTSVLDEKGR